MSCQASDLVILAWATLKILCWFRAGAFPTNRRGGTGARAMDMPESVYREEDQEESGDDEDKGDQDGDEGRFRDGGSSVLQGMIRPCL